VVPRFFRVSTKLLQIICFVKLRYAHLHLGVLVCVCVWVYGCVWVCVLRCLGEPDVQFMVSPIDDADDPLKRSSTTSTAPDQPVGRISLVIHYDNNNNNKFITALLQHQGSCVGPFLTWKLSLVVLGCVPKEYRCLMTRLSNHRPSVSCSLCGRTNNLHYTYC